MLNQVEDFNEIKKKFKLKFHDILSQYPVFRLFLFNVFVEGTAYVVGGFLRDLVNGRESRDLDMILNMSEKRINELLNESELNFTINRFGGVKILLDNFQIDLWSIENNWSFKNNLIKINEQKIVDNIASGSFYNFDSLVVNVLSLEMCVKYYNQCINRNVLDINRKDINYKILNPTIEANILRAFYLKDKFKLDFSENCNDYLTRRIKYLKDNNDYAINRLIEIKRKYPKYDNELSDDSLKMQVIELLRKDNNWKLGI